MKRATPVTLSAVLVVCCTSLSAQLAFRPGGSNSYQGAKDLSGLSIKTPRTRLIHTRDTALPGGSMWLQSMDPFLAFKLGKDLTQREMQVKDGVFASNGQEDIAFFKAKLTDGVTPAITGNNQVSCGGCHASPYRDAGAGVNFAKVSGLGRNTPHFFGAGVLQMLGWQIRQKMMQQIDTNRNGWVDRSEMNDHSILIRPTPGASAINYGSAGDRNGDGQPDLNGIFRVWFLDKNGKILENATSLSSPGVAGYNFVLDAFGWGEKQYGLNPTLRIFVWDPFGAHGGLQAFDPTTFEDPERDGFGQISNSGFAQPWPGHIPDDLGKNRNSVGLSTDDPDGDGVISEITEGDLDVAEWYLLNSPRPGLDRQTDKTARGALVFSKMGCDSCHVQDWRIEAADPNNTDLHKRYLGDLRFFDLDVNFSDPTNRLEGKLVRLYSTDPATGEAVRNRGSATIPGIGTDLRHHDMGDNFAEFQFDGCFVTSFRTGPLWGNGVTGFPWGHDGKSMTIDDVIRRHGGEAQDSQDRYLNASAPDREALLAWIASHVLYPTDQTPMDVNGDGAISDHFTVAGKDTGIERFNPEWLFKTPGEIEGAVNNPNGKPVRSDALVNVPESYGTNLAGMIDTDRDGFPDLLDECPEIPGVLDGCQ